MAMTLVKRVGVGAREMLRSCLQPRVYQRPAKDGFRVDADRLKDDVANVGRDMQAAMERRGQHPHDRSGD